VHSSVFLCRSYSFILLPTLPFSSFFFFNDPATTEIYTLSLHDALPILIGQPGTNAQDDAMGLRVDAGDLEVELVSHLEAVRGLLQSIHAELRERDESFQPLLQVHDHAAIQEADHLALHDEIRNVLLREGGPRVLAHLLQAERNPTRVLVDGEDDHVHLVPLLQHLAGMHHAPGPGHVADVDQTVDALLDFHEGAEVREVPDFPAELRADREALIDCEPRIRLGLLQPERDLLVLLVDLENHRLDLVSDRDHLRGMANVTRPGHLGDVDQPFDPLLQLHEGAVIGDRDDLALALLTHLVALVDVLLRIRRELLHAERA